MASENWQERLEAYLDGELDDDDAAAFAAETAASAALRAELAARREFRARVRGVLLDRAAPARLPSARGAARVASGRSARRTWAAAAAAALLTLALLAPPLVRRLTAPSPPLAPDLRAGQVVAVRYGEIPNATVTLKTGSHDLATDTVR